MLKIRNDVDLKKIEKYGLIEEEHFDLFTSYQ